MRCLILLLLCLPALGCKSLERLFRNSPFQEVESSADRVNLWPLYYANGASTAVLWPLFDEDDKGFALRPLITRDGTHWEVLPPLCYWDTDSGNWVVAPAYAVDESFGVFPLFGTGWVEHLGPVWWKTVPGAGEVPDRTSFGLFPLFGYSQDSVQVGPAFWGYRDGGELGYVLGLPLFTYFTRADASGGFLSLLGGRGWDPQGETSFVNVLGPVFHYDRDGATRNLSVLWPLFTSSNGPHYDGWQLWPVIGRGTEAGADGVADKVETLALGGLYRHAGRDDVDSVRLLPLFSYRDADAGPERWFESLSLYGHKQYADGTTAVHVGTPMLFNYRGGPKLTRFSALLGTVDYETHGDASEFSLLYYLYRQKTVGTETRRDLFPFLTWDSGEQRSGFSFLWRLFSWQRTGDKVSGHVFFIPWGHH